MKKFLNLFILLFLFCLGCARFKTKNLTPHIEFSLSIGKDINNIKIIQTSDYFFEIPSEYFIKDKFLYLVDIFNFRVLKVGKKDKIILKFGEKYQEEKISEINLFNTNFSGLKFNNDLFKFVEPGQIYIDNKNNIFVENVLSSITEEHRYNAYSIILKFDSRGKPLEIYGKKISKEGNIYPFEELDHFSVDINDNLFVVEKRENEWKIYKFSSPDKIIGLFTSSSLLSNIKIPKDEKAVIENVDHSFTGDFIIAGVSFYKNKYQFIKTDFYKISFSGKIERLFSLKNEEYNFILLNNSDIIYLWKTDEKSKKYEKIVLRLLNLKGKVVLIKNLKLRRSEAKWFNIKVQKNDIITGINLSHNCFNIVVWE